VKSSTLFTIGFSGIGISILAAFIPLLVAAFGKEALSEQMSSIFDELTLSTTLILSVLTIFRGMAKKKREIWLAEMDKHTKKSNVEV